VFDTFFHLVLLFDFFYYRIFSFPYFVNNYIKKKAKFEINEKLYKIPKYFFLLLEIVSKIAFFLNMILVFEFLRALKFFW